MPGKQQWMILGLIGMVLVVIALPTGKSQETNVGVQIQETGLKDESVQIQTSALEQQLQEILSRIEGVGETSVMVYASDTQESFSSLGGDSPRGEILGVLVVAQGADSPQTIKNIQDAVMALFQVEAHKIKVMKMK